MLKDEKLFLGVCNSIMQIFPDSIYDNVKFNFLRKRIKNLFANI